MQPPASSAPLLLLASVLKPVDDPRMYEKFGRSLAAAGYRVLVAGRGSAGLTAKTYHTANSPGLKPWAMEQAAAESAEAANAAGGVGATQTHPFQRPIFHGHRLSPDRLKAQVRYWQLLRQHRPALVIVHAPELLPLTLLWQALGRGRRFLYDVRENYALNIQTQQVYRGLLRRVLAAGVKWLESRAARRAAVVLLAERSYADELDWLPAERTVVLENKHAVPSAAPGLTPRQLPRPDQPLRLLFSGTLSTLTGVFDAIAFTAQLRQAWPGAQLTIIGYCQRPDERARLEQLAAEHAAWLRLIGGAQPVPHARILAEIGRHDLGLLPYQEHPSSWRCLPTKLYEYLAAALPVLIPPNPLWQAEVGRYQAGVTVDFSADVLDADALLRQLIGRRFYPAGPVAAARWDSEAPRLLAAVRAALGAPELKTAGRGAAL